MAQRLKRLPPMWETQVRSLGWDDPLEREIYIFIYIYRERERALVTQMVKNLPEVNSREYEKYF